MVVRDGQSIDVAVISRHGDELVLESLTGNRIRFQPAGLQRRPPTEWLWKDDVQEYMHFQERYPKQGSRGGWRLNFSIPPSAAEFQDLPLLLVIGWYGILRAREDERTRAG
jgi:hypothetical protein